jgi:5'(3')-deoxyribonucleotidase
LGEITSDSNDLETLMKNHNDPLQFWRKPDLYDNLKPLDDALIYIPKLKELGLEIIFVSACMPEHEQSKRFFLQRNFPFMGGFISTGDKSFVRCDYFVDDYKKYCRQMKDHAHVFHIKTELNTPSEEFPYVTWEEIYNRIRRTEINCLIWD